MITNKTNRSRSFDVYIRDKLKQPEYVREYINETLAILDEDVDSTPEDFIATLMGCLKDIIEANGGINQFAKKIPELHRTTLYGLFSEQTKRKNGPEFLTVLRIMKVCGVSLQAA